MKSHKTIDFMEEKEYYKLSCLAGSLNRINSVLTCSAINAFNAIDEVLT